MIWISAIAMLVSVSVGSFANAAGVAGPRRVQLDVPGGKLRAFVDPVRGAELAGLEVLGEGHWSELLYRGLDDRPTDDWTGRAPLLWPAVGRNFVGPPAASDRGNPEPLAWSLHGRVYPMPLHGFARDQPWQILDQGSASVKLVLRDNEATHQSYPFGFEFTTEYRLSRESLCVLQSVRAAAANREAMPFSIGNHLTLHLPLRPGGDPAGTTLVTPATEQVITDRSGRPTGQVVIVNYARPRRLDSLERRMPISLSGYPPGQAWVRLIDPSGFTVTIAHTEDRRPPGVPVLFNLWGDVGQGFFAPEPWVGKQNSLVTGDGLIKLAPGETFHWKIVVGVSGV